MNLANPLRQNLLPILQQSMNNFLLKMPLEMAGVAAAASPMLATDFLVLLWRLLDSIPVCPNPLSGVSRGLSLTVGVQNFAELLLDRGQRTHIIMVVLLYFCLEYKDTPAQLGLVKLSAFLLQTLSAERPFGSALNKPLDARIPLPSKYCVPGTAADFLIQHLYTLIFSTKGALNAIYPAFILSITNVSPYLKSPSITTSTRLTQLFLAMSNPTFLLSDEANARLVYYILEAFNNVIQFQLSGQPNQLLSLLASLILQVSLADIDCPNLIYSLIRSHARFEELANFTVASGVASIKRAREQRAGKAAAGADDKSSRRASMVSERDGGLPLTTPASEAGNPLPKLVDEDEKATLAGRDRQQQLQEEKSEDSAAGAAATQPQNVSPASEYPPPRQTQAGRILSEKAAGKQPMRSMSQLTLHSEVSLGGEGEEASFVARNGFVPTEGWVASWREGLPIDAILILISECLPKVASLSSLSTNTAALEYLRSVTLVGLLPLSPGPKPRPFLESTHSTIWLMSLAWGNVYVHSLEVAGGAAAFWRGTSVKLFNVKQTNDRGSMQAVMSSLVGQGLSRLNLGGGSGSGHSSPNDERSSFMRSRSASSSAAANLSDGGTL